MKREIITILFLFGSIEHIIACSGPGASEAIKTSIEIGNYCAFGSIGLTLLSVWINRKFRTKTTTIILSISILLTVIHPGFWISALTGDCGMMRLNSSIMITSLITLILLWIVIKTNRKPAANGYKSI